MRDDAKGYTNYIINLFIIYSLLFDYFKLTVIYIIFNHYIVLTIWDDFVYRSGFSNHNGSECIY